MLNICFLGKTKFEYNGNSVAEPLGNKTAALICLLVLNQKKYLSREKVIAYLWPDSNEDAAKYNMRFNLWLIKKNIGVDSQGNHFLHVDKDCCGISEKYEYQCDILDIMRFKPSEEDSIDSLLKLREIFVGDFLEGYYFNNCDELNELILFERINFEKRKVRILKRLACLYETNQNYDACMDIINEIHEIEPYDEEMALKIMNLHMLKGSRVGAINYYNNFSNKLATSLGISPSESLKTLYNEIRNQSTEVEEVLDNISTTAVRSGTIGDALNLSICCMKNVEYFWVAEVIDQILKKIDVSYICLLDRKYILDLGYIQREILRCLEDSEEGMEIYSTKVPSVRIANAFIKLIMHIISKYTLCIEILNPEDLDTISASMIEYLQRVNMEGLTIVP
jgi:DNA-binding SARP family transcriptional activator